MKSVKRRRAGKNGSYLVEATLTLPIFILSVVALSLIINIIAICENICFVTAQEVHEIDVQAYGNQTTVSLCKMKLKTRVLHDCDKLTRFRIRQMHYLYRDSAMGVEDLIDVQTQADFQVNNPVGIHGKIRFTQALLTRGFTGALQDAQPLGEEAFSTYAQASRVVIFPKYGQRYHRPDCYYVTREEAKSAYRLEMDREEAARRGYTACLVCGGG